MDLKSPSEFVEKFDGTVRSAHKNAMVLARQGIPVFPVCSNKIPACPHGFKDAATDVVFVEQLWTQYPAQLVGVPTGALSGIDALDIDPRHDGDKWLVEHAEEIPVTRIHCTRSGGWHYLFQHHTGLRNSAGIIAPGIDVRGDGGYIIWWPAAGFAVQSDVPLAQWSDWLLSMALPPPPQPRSIFTFAPKEHCGSLGVAYAHAALCRATDNMAFAPEGQRNDTLNREMYSLLRFVANGALDAEEIATTLASAALAAGLGRSEIESTLVSALRAWRIHHG